ncbi:hypothetical protein DRE_00324 [Drechslerella stenobrocha 248]|uniref:Clr5 domain-containing protein n=1 Tax=Drechslerella stenobrocha 248 TaxID=1043628 RepID=W7HTB7_9PEZI|nr:hypothetical protein DRE_00324 [Drechslerella stenobrocha 248]
MDYRFVAGCSVPQTRHYIRLEDLEPYRAYILEKHESGLRQKRILTALETEKGVHIELANLKRALEKWGKSRKNLTKGRKLYIRNRVEKRRLEGKVEHRVRLKRSGRDLDQQEIEAIMANTPGFFRGLKESPADIEFLPTPGARESENRVGSLGGASGEMFGGHNTDPDSIVQVDDPIYNIRHSTGTSVPAVMQIETGELPMPDDGTFDHFSESLKIYPYPGADWETVIAAEEDHYKGKQKNGEDKTEDLVEVIVKGLDDLSVAPSGPPSPKFDLIVSQESGELYSQEAERFILATTGVEQGSQCTPLSKYAHEHQDDYDDYIRTFEEEAKDFILQVQSLSAGKGISLEEAEYMLSQQIVREMHYSPLPYHIYSAVLDDSYKVSSSDVEFESTAEYKHLYETYHKLVEENFAAIKSSVDTLPQGSMSCKSFNRCIVHFPRILKEYGVYHFFTASTLYWTARLIGASSLNQPEFLNTVYSEALYIFDRIGMSYHTTPLDCFYRTSRLGVEVDPFSVRRQSIRQKILKKFGRYDPRTIFVFSDLASQLLNSPSLVKQGEMIAHGIFHIIEHSQDSDPSTGLNNMWIIRSLVLLGETLRERGKYRLSARLLERAWSWEKADKTPPRGVDSLIRCPFPLGVVYSKLRQYKRSLEILLDHTGKGASAIQLPGAGVFQDTQIIGETWGEPQQAIHGSLEGLGARWT